MNGRLTESLFSYGTLQLEHIQRALFGRAVPMTPDTLAGYRITQIETRDPAAVAASGVEIHKALVADDGAPEIAGVLLDLTAIELAAADTYEGADYRRVSASFGSGRTGWVYIRA